MARIMRSAERQIAEIERRIGAGGDQSDKDTRALSLLARTVRELTAIDAMNREIEQRKQGRRDNDKSDELPRDIDELRASVAHKLQQLIADAKEVGDSEAES
ncbi:MAG: hypothetical protein ACR2K5_09880 [Pseudolabrys sp.]